MEAFVRGLPKAELHVHLEGTLEPEMMFEMARRNRVPLRFGSVEEVQAAYEFSDLQSFLDIYYDGAEVLRTEQDFFDLTYAYLEKVVRDGVRRAEVFFDPQTHTERGIPFEAVVSGISRALAAGRTKLDISSGLIMCFLRHMSAESAHETLEQALPYRELLLGVGLDSSEVGNPPEKFDAVFAQARRAGMLVVAHAGEEGPPEYIWGALDTLHARRVDHGVRSEEDADLLIRLVEERVPLTMCPLSNVKLRVFPTLNDHNLKRLLDRGLVVTVNSDDPAYFGGYVGENYLAVARALKLSRDDLALLARNSFEAAFLRVEERRVFLAELDEYVAAH
ncbi:MAG: adenosine deaminase [Acidimicrobiia bacterium]|nr:adenosine deaminase [Acidimicrobiia bacterium]MDH3396553.1 adenosine deaminase [Acidimicrobiia bacterium]MDH5614990.1 adenosine deaminase [Acidimicrobiia bacterium]